MNKKITEIVLKPLSSPESFSRGYGLYQSDAVFDTFKQSESLIGKCEGSSAPFYQMSFQLDEGGILGASCTCPYEWGGYCKHIIALVLTYIHEPSAFIKQKDIEELLGQLDKDTLMHLIAKMVDKKPGFVYLAADFYSSRVSQIPNCPIAE